MRQRASEKKCVCVSERRRARENPCVNLTISEQSNAETHTQIQYTSIMQRMESSLEEIK